MVFGWGKKKEKQDYLERQIKSIHLSEIPEIASGLIKLRESKTVTEIKMRRDRLTPLLSELAHIGRELEKDDLDVEDIDKHIRTIVVRGKKQVIDIIKKDVTELPDISSYDDAVLLINALNQTIKKMGDVLGRQTRVIHIFAKKYAAKLKDILTEMTEISDEIKKLLTNFENSESSFAEIDSAIKEIADLERRNDEARQKIHLMNGSLATCQDKIASCKKSIESIKSSAEYTRLLEAKERMGRLDSKKNNLKNKIHDHFTKISRPLGRYNHASSLDKEQKILLATLIQSPFDALTVSNKDSILTILENVKKAVMSGSISVKDKEKSLSHITGLEEAISGLISETEEYHAEQAVTKDTIKKATPTKLAILEKDLARHTADKPVIESRIKSTSDEISANTARIPHITDDIEIKLRRFSNIRYVIVAEN